MRETHTRRFFKEFTLNFDLNLDSIYFNGLFSSIDPYRKYMHLVFYDHLMYELKQYQIVFGVVYTLRETRNKYKKLQLSFF